MVLGFCLFVSAVVVVFWVFFFFPPEVIFFDAFFQSLHRSKSPIEEKLKNCPLTFGYLGRIPNIHPLYGLSAECLWFRAVNLSFLGRSAQCWHYGVPCRGTALERGMCNPRTTLRFKIRIFMGGPLTP